MYRLRDWFNIKVIIGAIIFALVVFAILVWVLWSAKAEAVTPVSSTAIVSIIKAPTQTPIRPKTTATSTLQPTSAEGTPLPTSGIKIGDYVQVKGTGGDGLRLHATASVPSEVRYLAIESEVFIVSEGPEEADGYTWWLLEDPVSKNPVGWGVSNYLSVVENP